MATCCRKKVTKKVVMKATMSLRGMSPLKKKAYLYKNKYVGGPLHDVMIESKQKKTYKDMAKKAKKRGEIVKMKNETEGYKSNRRITL